MALKNASLKNARLKPIFSQKLNEIGTYGTYICLHRQKKELPTSVLNQRHFDQRLRNKKEHSLATSQGKLFWWNAVRFFAKYFYETIFLKIKGLLIQL